MQAVRLVMGDDLDDKRHVLIKLNYVIAVLVLATVVSAVFTAGEAGTGNFGRAVGFAATFSVLLEVFFVWLVRHVLIHYPTPLGIGILMGLFGLMACNMITLAVLFAGFQFISNHGSYVAMTVFSVLLTLLYAAGFTIILKFHKQVYQLDLREELLRGEFFPGRMTPPRRQHDDTNRLLPSGLDRSSPPLSRSHSRTPSHSLNQPIPSATTQSHAAPPSSSSAATAVTATPASSQQPEPLLDVSGAGPVTVSVGGEGRGTETQTETEAATPSAELIDDFAFSLGEFDTEGGDGGSVEEVAAVGASDPFDPVHTF